MHNSSKLEVTHMPINRKMHESWCTHKMEHTSQQKEGKK